MARKEIGAGSWIPKMMHDIKEYQKFVQVHTYGIQNFQVTFRPEASELPKYNFEDD